MLKWTYIFDIILMMEDVVKQGLVGQPTVQNVREK